MKIRTLLSFLAILLFSTFGSFAQTLFSDNFDTDSSANWAVFRDAGPGNGTDSVADFAYDYGTIGIPTSPGAGGTTRGLKFNVNQSSNLFQGISASPIGQNFTGNYRLRFHAWLNFVGPMPAGGNGTTQLGTFGIGAKGTQVQWAITNPDALEFAISLDGGSADDYRVYSNATHVAATVAGVYAAGSRNNSALYYSTNFPGQTPPAAQTAIYGTQTGAAQNGTLGYAWRDVIVEKSANIVTWTVDGILIATCGTTATFSTNIFLGMFDSNAASSTEPNDFLNMIIFDNVRVEALSGAQIDIVATGDATEGGTAGGFTISRTGSTDAPLTVNFTVTGSAGNGTDYTAITSSATIAIGQASTNLAISAINDAVAELTETVAITISSSTNYIVGTSAATVAIVDNEKSELSITTVSPSMYERTVGDYARFQIVRRGDTNVNLTATVSYSGTAAGSRFSGPASVGVNAGTVNQTFDVSPIDNATLEGDQTVIATIIGDPSYNTGVTNSATTTLLDDELPAETVLFADPLTSDTSANWKTNFGANNLIPDFSVDWAYDVQGDAISAAPNGSTLALKMTVNKLDTGNDLATTNGAAGINLYPLNKNFAGDYALRFNMYLVLNSSGGTTEFAQFGINHSGNKTNWVRLNGLNIFNNPPRDIDGLWYMVSSDASGSAPGDYALLTGTNATNTAFTVSTAAATAFTQAFKKPPFSSIAAGSPANVFAAGASTWVDVEVKKIGSVVTMSINKTRIFQYTNTTAFTSGNIMLGYSDPYESVGTGGGAVYFSNVRVVNLSTTVVQPSITAIQLINSGTQVQIDFTGGASDTFTLQSSGVVTGPYGATTATITSTGPGAYRAVAAVNGSTRFYQIKVN